MTGEMTQSEVTREAYPLHFALADAFDGEVRAFDQYQGPYVRSRIGTLWIQPHESWDGIFQVWNEHTEKLSEPFPFGADAEWVVSAATETE